MRILSYCTIERSDMLHELVIPEYESGYQALPSTLGHLPCEETCAMFRCSYRPPEKDYAFCVGIHGERLGGGSVPVLQQIHVRR
jgi:hypothetical protein